LAAALGVACTAPDVPVTAAPASAAQAPVRGSQAAAAFDAARAWEDLRRQVAIGPRPAGTAAIEECRRYIEEQLKAAGIRSTRQVFVAPTPIGEMTMANIVATVPGRRPERIILASHYDTKRFADIRFVGANDGASSTAALLELGRALAGRQPELTIELLFFDGEEAVNRDWGVTGEDNTYGSHHYVRAAQKSGTLAGIKAMILLDMVGEIDAVFPRDGRSTPWLVDVIWSTAAKLGHGRTFSNAVSEVEDDHIPFLRAGVPAADIIDLDYPEWHTAGDDLQRVSSRSLQIVGDVVLAALPAIEQRVLAAPR
jgi:Zn-dependent M28 family amino/carboxypeptidase